MRRSPVIKMTVFLGMAALLVAGCSSSKNSSSGTPTAAASTAAPAAAPSSAAPASAAAGGSGGAVAPAGPATVASKTGALGNYLTDGSGKSLYVYTPDTSSTSTCYGECVAAWPALLTTGPATAGTGADTSMLGTTKRTDGTTQVTYNGHPLYYFEGDKSAGDTNGQGKAGIWFLLAPEGTQIGGGASSPAAAASS